MKQPTITSLFGAKQYSTISKQAKSTSTESNDSKYLMHKTGKCTICGETCLDLTNHLDTYHKIELKKIFGCRLTLKRCKSNSKPKIQHRGGNKKGDKQDKQQFYCRYCNEPIYARMNLDKHEPLCKVIGKFRDGTKCLICNSRMQTSARKHYREKHLEIFNKEDQAFLFQEATGQCKHCSLVFKSGLKSHEDVCKEFLDFVKGDTCLVCDKKFSSGKNFRSYAFQHVRTVHKNLISKKSGKNNKINSDSSNHEVKKLIPQGSNMSSEPHNKNKTQGSTIFDCRYCNMTFKHVSGKTNHEKTCLKYSKYIQGSECLICKKMFKNRKNTILHFKSVHKDLSLKEASPKTKDSTKSQKSFTSSNLDKSENNETIKCQGSVLEEIENNLTEIDQNESNSPEIPASGETMESDNQESEKLSLQCLNETTDTYETNETRQLEESIQSLVEPVDIETSNIAAATTESNVEVDTEEIIIEPESEGETVFPIVKYEQSLVKRTRPAFQNFDFKGEDPRAVHMLYKCPVCFGMFVNPMHIHDHITRFHRMAPQHIARMGLKVEELSVSNL